MESAKEVIYFYNGDLFGKEDWLYLSDFVMTHQKSFGVPNHVRGQMVTATITIHKHLDNAWWLNSVIKSEIKMMNTQALPYRVMMMQARMKKYLNWIRFRNKRFMLQNGSKFAVKHKPLISEQWFLL